MGKAVNGEVGRKVSRDGNAARSIDVKHGCRNDDQDTDEVNHLLPKMTVAAACLLRRDLRDDRVRNRG